MTQLDAVDMFHMAREAQDADKQRFRPGNSFRLLAPAKVNLFLNIGEQFSDGYHSAVSVMHSLLLHDVLYMKRSLFSELPFWEQEKIVSEKSNAFHVKLPTRTLHIMLTMRGFNGVVLPQVAPENNIVVRAVSQLASLVEIREDEVIDLHLEKHIPAQAGLGGGSSDAAAAIKGAVQWWGLDLTNPQVEEITRSLGADVLFFLHGGCAYLDGRGDIFNHALTPMNSPVVLVKPNEGVSTAASYAEFDKNPTKLSSKICIQAEEATRACEVPLANNLQPASFRVLPELKTVESWLSERCNENQILMSGSGSAFFAQCNSLAEASAIAGKAKKRGWWARATSFSSFGASFTPVK